MPLQFVHNINGSTTAVIIPIDEWNELVHKHHDLKQLELRSKTSKNKTGKPSDFAGTLSKEGYRALSEHIKQARSEWEKDTF